MQNISLKNAQSFVIDSQLLSGNSTFKGKNGTLDVIEKLGYIFR